MMKTSVKLAITIIGSIFLIFITLWIKKEYKKFIIKSSELERKAYFNTYEQFYVEDGISEYPQSDKEVIFKMKNSLPALTDSIYSLNDMKTLNLSIDNNCYWHQFYLQNIDKFSDNKNVAIYFPLYNRDTRKRESFVILSAGIDGKQNNFLTEKDTLYIDDWQTKLKLYNTNHPYMNVCDSIMFFDYNEAIKFNLFKRLFGCKDQLLQVGRTDFSCTNWRTRSEEEMAIINKKIDRILEKRRKLD